VNSSLHIKTDEKPDWSEVRTIRDRVANAVSEFPEEVREAAVMAASELVENAIKYGDSVSQQPGIELSLVCDEGTLCLTVASGSRDPEAIRELLRHTEELAKTRDKSELYMRRIQALMENQDGRSRLGLYRIGYEGLFDLTCSYEDDVVRMTATRSLG
jgi:anti-sigma regulatory factor (Ser/Thr protein kinase)